MKLLFFNSLPASGHFCHLLKTFAKSLEPDQALQNVGPDLDPNCLTMTYICSHSTFLVATMANGRVSPEIFSLTSNYLGTNLVVVLYRGLDCTAKMEINPPQLFKKVNGKVRESHYFLGNRLLETLFSIKVQVILCSEIFLF